MRASSYYRSSDQCHEQRSGLFALSRGPTIEVIACTSYFQEGDAPVQVLLYHEKMQTITQEELGEQNRALKDLLSFHSALSML
jgi:hypothetical protein